ncbi:methyltransferase domain-containing protein [Nocardioides caeni]|uniref:Methyltransferase domain-containing protein n=1 Tax=Nocardioides caeni TaxID=574700 RepID=A0A4V4HLF3_9ACTN|nr:methyltransferase domain-containing protein [Nocardioides caeni]
MECAHFTAGECRSCSWLLTPYDAQLTSKQGAVRAVLDPVTGPGIAWEPPVASALAGFRNKAKMVVSGTSTEPVLGILGPDGGVDLRDCALHTPGIVAALPHLAAFVTRAELAPYDVGSTAPVAQRGELKHLLVTESPDGDLMVRIVLRSTATESRIRKHLSWLTEQLPHLRVVTINVQPDHVALLEGEREIVLTEERTLPMRLGAVTLRLGPRSFFQTNTVAAAALYDQAAQWTDEVAPERVVDLYCGVGGFALHVAGPGRRVTGIEISDEAIRSAERARDEAGLVGQVDFAAGDATSSDHAGLVDDADLVIVNPPRRGLGSDLATRLEDSGVPHVLYSSCNPDTLARDLAVMTSYRAVRARLVDMFPHTPHAEVLVLLERTRVR